MTPPGSRGSTFLIQAGAIKMTEATLEVADLCPFSTRACGDVGGEMRSTKNKNRIINCASGSSNSKDNECPVQKVLATVPPLLVDNGGGASRLHSPNIAFGGPHFNVKESKREVTLIMCMWCM